MSRSTVVRGILVAGVIGAVVFGTGSAQAGLLSRAETGDGSASAAAVVIGTTETGEVIAIAPVSASASSDGSSASAALLRVLGTNVGEAAPGRANLLAVLNGQPTEMIVDGGCDDGGAPACLILLRSDTDTGDDDIGNAARADYVVAFIGAGDTAVGLLGSSAGAGGNGCYLGSAGVVAALNTEYIDLSEAHDECAA